MDYAFKCPHSPSAQATLLLRAAPSLGPNDRDSSVLPKFRRSFHGRQYDANLSRLSDQPHQHCPTLDRTTTSFLHQATVSPLAEGVHIGAISATSAVRLSSHSKLRACHRNIILRTLLLSVRCVTFRLCPEGRRDSSECSNR